MDLTILILQVGKLRLGEAEATLEGSEAGQEPGSWSLRVFWKHGTACSLQGSPAPQLYDSGG